MLILGLSGPRGSGKSTAAEVLVREHGFVELRFADPIRDAVLGLFREWGEQHFEPGLKDALCPVYRIAPRAALRAFGESARALDPYCYVSALGRRLEALEDAKTPRVVVSDVRLPAEAEHVRELGGHVVHVVRPGCHWTGEHATEQGPGYQVGDLRLQNPGSLETYRTQCRALVSAVAPGGRAYG
jgi:hypothetical protein